MAVPPFQQAPSERGRILVVTATYPPTRCGVGEYVKRLGHELTRAGSQVFVLTGVGEDPEHRHDAGGEDMTAAVDAPPAGPGAGAAPKFLPQPDGVHLARVVDAWSWQVLGLVEAACRALRPDLVSLQYHGEDYLLHPAVCAIPALCAQRGVPAVTTLHNLQRPRRWQADRDPLLELLQTSAALIVTNRMDQRALLDAAASARDGAPAFAPAALHLIPAGPCITAPAQPSRPNPGGPLRLFYFGFLNPFKGIEYLLRAVALLRAQGKDVALTMAAGVHTEAPGRLRAYARFIQDEIDALQLGPVLTRLDYIPDDEVSRRLLECELAVFPFRDGLSGKNSSFWGTLHHGTPALTTRGPGLPEGLVDGQNVLLAPPDDAAALAQRIAWALDHRDQLPALGERGRAYVHERHGWHDLAHQTLRVFDAARGTTHQGATA